jgi:UPF0489 domain
MHFVKDHHQVLPIWADYRRQLTTPPRLLTLDHHTDTSLPFRTFLKNQFPNDIQLQNDQRQKLLKKIDFLHPETLNTAVAQLSHDEHVLTALQTDIISSACVIAHNARDTDLKTFQEHKVICFSVERNPFGKGLLPREYDQILESPFLESALEHFDTVLGQNNESKLLSSPYILDIDLDYFNTHKSALPEDKSVFLKILKGAGLVTIATEPDYVKKCAVDSDLTADKILAALQSWI